MHSAVAASLGVTLLLVLAVAPASADNNPPAGNNPPPVGNRDSWGWTDDQGVGATANQANAAPASEGSARSGSGPQQCHYELLPQDQWSSADDMAAQGWGPPKGTEPGAWYRK